MNAFDGKARRRSLGLLSWGLSSFQRLARRPTGRLKRPCGCHQQAKSRRGFLQLRWNADEASLPIRAIGFERTISTSCSNFSAACPDCFDEFVCGDFSTGGRRAGSKAELGACIGRLCMALWVRTRPGVAFRILPALRKAVLSEELGKSLHFPLAVMFCRRV